ncbi:Cas10/Cmr2 second palm domain-containing protein [Thermoflexus hugenholtzii]
MDEKAVSSMETVLLMGDVDAIKDYVFESSRLPQIRGASALLMRCEAEIRQRIREANGRILVARGGFLLAEVPAAQIHRLAEEIPRIFASHTITATMTLAWEDPPGALPPPPSPIADGWAGRLIRAAPPSDPFPRRVAFLAARLRAAKESRSTVPTLETLPFARKCAICARRNASEPLYLPEGPLPVCPVCSTRHRAGWKARSGLRRMWHLWHPDFLGEPPQDLEQLVEGEPHGRLAFIYADGNDIGRHLMTLSDPQAYQAFSRKIYRGTRRAVFEALGIALKGWQGNFWPFELINIGGDDITLLIQARYALPFALAFLERFHLHTSFTASCAIVIADHKYPIRYFEALAADLLKGAKERAKSGPEPDSALHFLWLPEPVAGEEADLFLQRYQSEEGGRRLRWTARPYRLAQAWQLYELALALKDRVSRSQRQQWAEALTQGVLPSVQFIQYQIARAPQGDRSALRKLLERARDLCGFTGASHLLFWVEEPGRAAWVTAMMDLLEWAELLEAA